MSNISAWAVEQFRQHYPEENITATDIFCYVYGVLHTPRYADQYRTYLLNEAPRIPLYEDFGAYKTAGAQLINIHRNHASAKPYPLRRLYNHDRNGTARLILRVDRDNRRVILDTQTTLVDLPSAVFEYRIAAKSAISWALHPYRNRTHRYMPEQFSNRHYDPERHDDVITHIGRVCTVSLQTVQIIRSLSELNCHADRRGDI